MIQLITEGGGPCLSLKGDLLCLSTGRLLQSGREISLPEAMLTCAHLHGETLFLGDKEGRVHYTNFMVDFANGLVDFSVDLGAGPIIKILSVEDSVWALTESQLIRMGEEEPLVRIACPHATDAIVLQEKLVIAGSQPMLRWWKIHDLNQVDPTQMLMPQAISTVRDWWHKQVKESPIALNLSPLGIMEDSWKGHGRTLSSLSCCCSGWWLLGVNTEHGRVILFDGWLEMAPVWQWRGLRGVQATWLAADLHFVVWSPRSRVLEVWQLFDGKPKQLKQVELSEDYCLLPNGLLQGPLGVYCIDKP